MKYIIVMTQNNILSSNGLVNGYKFSDSHKLLRVV